MVKRGRLAIERALKMLGRLDGTAALQGIHDAAGAASFRGQIPPFLLAAFQREVLPPRGSPPTAPLDPHEAPSRKLLGYRAFERLSLLARTLLFVGLTETARDQAAQMQGDPAALERYRTAFEKHKALDDEAEGLLTQLGIQKTMAKVDADDVVAVLDAMALALSEADAKPAPPHYRQGLQIVGCRITRAKDKAAPLNLSSRRLPFPVSFVGCVFDMPVMVNETEMTSLDLSGSALPGLEARGLRTTGGVHLRRATVISAVSFAGARIGGVFDASDALFNQMGCTPPQQVEDADHGVLNLSKAMIGNEVLLERTRVWGGLSLRGMDAERSVFLTGAMIASPMAVLEKWAFDVLHTHQDARLRDDDLQARYTDMLRFGRYSERLGARLLHNPALPGGPDVQNDAPSDEIDDTDPLLRLECVLGDDWHAPSMEILLTESLRARTNAIRGDGLKIQGNLFAEHLRAYGRARLKSAQIAGSIRLAGAVLRSGDESRHAMDEICKLHDAHALRSAKLANTDGNGDPCKLVFEDLGQIVELRRRTALALDPQPLFVPQDFALDLREAFVDGDVSFAPGEQTIIDRTRDRPAQTHHALHPAEVYGVLALVGATLKGSFLAQSVRFFWRPGVEDKMEPPLRLRDRQALQNHDRWLRARARKSAEAAKTAPPRAPGKPPPRPPSNRPLIDQYVVDMRQCSVGRDVDLRKSDGLWGLHLEEARIRGRVRFCKSHRGTHMDERRLIRLPERATNVSGRINLQGARIEGDCALLHHPDFGPEIKAVKCVVDGRLSIYPTGVASRYVPKADKVNGEDKAKDEDEVERPEAAEDPKAPPRWRPFIDEEANPAPGAFKWWPCKHKWIKLSREQRDKDLRRGSRAYCLHCQAERFPRQNGNEDRSEWMIDLRNARVTIFGHPPSAWPHPGALSLDGFLYERSCSLGPLPSILAEPLRRRRNDDETPALNTEKDDDPPIAPRRLQFSEVTRYGIGLSAVILVVLVAACGLIVWSRGWAGPLLALFALLTLALPRWKTTFIGDPRDPRTKLQARQPGGRRTLGRQLALTWLGAAVAIVVACAILTSPFLAWAELGFRVVLAALLAVAATQVMFRWFITHSREQYLPLGLEYLARQRSEPNRFQFLTSRYSPNEPYRVAAVALRETGRYLAANEFERRRIENRQKILSWRMHGISKSSLVLAGLVSGFGFKLDRLASVVVTSIAVVAFASHWAADSGWLQFDPDPPKWGQEAISPRPPPRTSPWVFKPKDDFPAFKLPDGAEHRDCRERADLKLLQDAGSPWAQLDEDARVCPGWMYAFDLLFPIDLGEPHWKIPEEKLRSLRDTPLRMDLVRNIIAITQLYGALLAAFFIAALVLRAEAAFVRIEE